MATVAENLQTIKDSIDAIKQSIIDKGGTISGDITTWSDAISGISGSDNLKIFSIGVETRVYVDGMTWGEWVDSIYNTRANFGEFYKEDDVTCRIVCVFGYVCRDSGVAQVVASQLISDSIKYTISPGSGGGTN